MIRGSMYTGLIQAAMALAVSIVAVPAVLAQPVRDPAEAARQAQYQENLQRVLDDKAGYATGIVRRWESAARASGRWDERYATDFHAALLKLQPENLLAAGQAPTYDATMRVLATGRPIPTISGAETLPNALGDIGSDLVYTPLEPCRIVDTRVAGGPLGVNASRDFDVDGSTFASQGGSGASCGVPYGVSRAAALTITVTQPSAGGFLTAWAAFLPQPFASVLNFTAAQTIANTTIVPVNPGVGNDISIYSGGAATHVIVDVVGYFSAPVATALDCTTVSSAVVSVPVNTWTPIDANCPAGRTATGGGYTTPEGSLGYPGVWLVTVPTANGWRIWVDNQTNGNRSMQTFARCCRIPGR